MLIRTGINPDRFYGGDTIAMTEDERKELAYSEMSDPPMEITDSIAGLIVTPSDVPDEWREEFFPLLNKQMSVSNLKPNEIRNILDTIERLSIRRLNRGLRYELKADSERMEKAKMYAELELSLSKDGFGVKRITTMHKSVSVDNPAPKKPGVISRIFGSGD
jgi:hypothetical protein